MKTTIEKRGILSKAGSSDVQDLCADVEELRAAVQQAAENFVRISEFTPTAHYTFSDVREVANDGYDKLAAIAGAGVPHREIIGGAPTMSDLARDLRVCVLALRKIEGWTLNEKIDARFQQVNNIAHNALDEIFDDRGASEEHDKHNNETIRRWGVWVTPSSVDTNCHEAWAEETRDGGVTWKRAEFHSQRQAEMFAGLGRLHGRPGWRYEPKELP